MNTDLNRVEKNIAQVVTEFVTAHIGKEFKGADLRNAVALAIGFTRVAPSSPDRVMRDLKKRKKVNYKLVSRSKSLYLGLPVEEEPKQ